MKLTNTKEALNKFSDYVIQQSRTRLTKKGQNYTKQLYDSLRYDLDESDDGYIIDFYMSDYGQFQDKGVKGVKSTYGQSSNSPFRYKSSSNLKGLEYATGIFSKWAEFRRMQPRDKKGRFGSYKTMGYILANSIKKKGIKATMFFTKSFEMGFDKLPKELTTAFILDIEYQIMLLQKK